MKNLDNRIETSKTTAKTLNPWLAIFTRTKEALSFAWTKYPEDFIHRIFIVSGFVAALGIRIPDWLFLQPHPIGVMVQMLLMAPIAGVVVMYIFAAILRMIGKLLGQAVDSNRSKVMVAWTNLPFILFWGLFVIAYFAIDKAGIAPKSDGFWLFQGLIGYLPIIIASPFWAWGVIVRTRGIAWLFGFSGAKSFVTWLLTILLAYVPAITIAVVYFIIFFVASSASAN